MKIKNIHLLLVSLLFCNGIAMDNLKTDNIINNIESKITESIDEQAKANMEIDNFIEKLQDLTKIMKSKQVSFASKDQKVMITWDLQKINDKHEFFYKICDLQKINDKNESFYQVAYIVTYGKERIQIKIIQPILEKFKNSLTIHYFRNYENNEPDYIKPEQFELFIKKVEEKSIETKNFDKQKFLMIMKEITPLLKKQFFTIIISAISNKPQKVIHMGINQKIMAFFKESFILIYNFFENFEREEILYRKLFLKNIKPINISDRFDEKKNFVYTTLLLYKSKNISISYTFTDKENIIDYYINFGDKSIRLDIPIPEKTKNCLCIMLIENEIYKNIDYKSFLSYLNELNKEYKKNEKNNFLEKIINSLFEICYFLKNHTTTIGDYRKQIYAIKGEDKRKLKEITETIFLDLSIKNNESHGFFSEIQIKIEQMQGYEEAIKPLYLIPFDESIMEKSMKIFSYQDENTEKRTMAWFKLKKYNSELFVIFNIINNGQNNNETRLNFGINLLRHEFHIKFYEKEEIKDIQHEIFTSFIQKTYDLVDKKDVRNIQLMEKLKEMGNLLQDIDTISLSNKKQQYGLNFFEFNIFIDILINEFIKRINEQISCQIQCKKEINEISQRKKENYISKDGKIIIFFHKTNSSHIPYFFIQINHKEKLCVQFLINYLSISFSKENITLKKIKDFLNELQKYKNEKNLPFLEKLIKYFIEIISTNNIKIEENRMISHIYSKEDLKMAVDLFALFTKPSKEEKYRIEDELKNYSSAIDISEQMESESLMGLSLDLESKSQLESINLKQKSPIDLVQLKSEDLDNLNFLDRKVKLMRSKSTDLEIEKFKIGKLDENIDSTNGDFDESSEYFKY
jgi:hypothetical protein